MITKIFKLSLLILIMASVVPPAGAVADPEFWGGEVAVQSLKKVPDSILQEMQSKGTSSLFIVLSEQADLSGAKGIRNKKDKGQYVYHQLKEVAERTQPQVISELNLSLPGIQQYYIQNMILVREATPDMLLSAVNNVNVAKIRANNPFEFKNDQPMAYDANTPPNAPEWNLSHIGITDVWAEGVTGEGIVVANLDTGVDWDHPALKNHYRGWNGTTADHAYNWHDVGSSCGAVPCDTDEHGTHTMGTMVGDDGAGNQVGGAPGAKWIACGPLEDDAGFHECFEWFLAPYRYGETPAQGVPAMAPDVVNNSWGWPIGGGDYQYAPDLNALQAAGVFMEFSAGNEGDDCESLRSPGDYPEVLTTGASDVQNRIVSESWTYWGSSRGPAASGIPGAPNFIKPEIVAPGYDVRSSVPGSGYEGGWGGTSMAGPHTCAVVALLWSAAPSLIGDIDTTRQIILDNAYTQAGGAGYWNQTCQGINAATTIPNHVWGWGLIDAYACYTALAGVYLDKAMYQPNDSMIITVRDRTASGSVDVQIQSSVEPSWEYLTLSEVSTGQFEGTFLTTSNSPVHGDGAISVADGSTISVWYPSLDATVNATVDGQLPSISGVSITHIDSTSFTVSWQTNEMARSIINYWSTGPIEEIRDEALTTSHSMTIDNLDPCTFYYFDVLAEDQAGNIALDNNGGAHYGAQTYELVVYLSANMDTNPNWTYENQWAWGVPTGNSGDPSSGYTGSNVVGYNLNGSYTNNMPETFCTTQSIDCSQASEVILSYYYWLGVESATWDHASVRVSANGGSTWTTIWDHTGSSSQPSSWSYAEYNISAVAAGSSDVKIRWVMGASDSSVVYCGWNIDDVMVSFESPCEEATPTPGPTFTPTPPPTSTPEECINNGDVNLSGDITAGDAQMAFQIALGLITPTEEEECAADCNGDLDVTAGDAQQIFMTALGTASCVDPL
ncbi:S8 family serine peptidase [bacterium]|nr:S8 family serine peptidase [candidate division CSSED10-310 bacterium]